MKEKANHKREGSNLFHICNYLFLGLIFVIVAYPLYFVLISSISSPSMVGTGPRRLRLRATAVFLRMTRS